MNTTKKNYFTKRAGVYYVDEVERKKMNKGIQQEKFKIWDLKWFCFDKKG